MTSAPKGTPKQRQQEREALDTLAALAASIAEAVNNPEQEEGEAVDRKDLMAAYYAWEDQVAEAGQIEVESRVAQLAIDGKEDALEMQRGIALIVMTAMLMSTQEEWVDAVLIDGNAVEVLTALRWVMDYSGNAVMRLTEKLQAGPPQMH